MLFHVFDEAKPAGYFLHEPTGSYRSILDADWFLYILLPALLIVIVAVLMLLWHLHEIPKHKADHKKMRQAELVSALTILGLFEHWVWPIALFIAYTDWDAVEEFFVRVLRRSRVPAVDMGNAQPEAVSHASTPAPVASPAPAPASSVDAGAEHPIESVPVATAQKETTS